MSKAKSVKQLVSVPVRHIGHIYPICGVEADADMRTDLGYDRYKRLGVSERFKGEEPYRICGRCLAIKRAESNKLRAMIGMKLCK